MNKKQFDPYTLEQRRIVDRLVEAEETALAKRKAELEACECKEGMFPSGGTSRRAFLAGGAASLIAGTAAAATPGAFDYLLQDDPTKVQGRLTNDDGGYGSRS